MTVLQPGPTNSLTDLASIRVGHADRRGAGWMSHYGGLRVAHV
jgi:hypothetical protein